MQGSAVLWCGGIAILSLMSLLAGQTERALAAEGGGGPSARQEQAIELSPVVVTATRGERPNFDLPNAVTIVDREHVERQTPTVLPDLLRGEAGIFIQQTTPGQAAPIIRGLIGSSILMLVDGMRLNTAFFRSAPNQYFALVDPYNVDRLEAVRGAGSTLYGSDAMGGVLNVITPIPRVTTDQWQLHGKALGQFSSADTSWVNRLSLQGGRSGIAMSGGFTYQDHNDLRGGGEIGVQRPSGYEVYAGDGTIFLERGDQDLLFSVQYLQQPKTPRFDELVPGFRQSQPSSAVFFFEPNDRLFAHGRYRLRNPLPFVDGLEFHVAFQEINDDRRNRDFGGTREDRERNRDRLIGLTLQLTSRWREWMTFTYGGEIYLDEVSSSRVGTNIDTGATSARQSRFADGSTLNSFGVYVQDEIRLHPRLTAILGARFSHFDVDIPKADRGEGAEAHLGTSDLTGSVGLVYHVTPAVNLVTNFGRGFRVPNVFDLSTLGPRPGNRFNIPNPDLSTEEVFTVDVGVKVKLPRFAGEVFGFYSDFRDKIEDSLTGDCFRDGVGIVPPAQCQPTDRLVVQSQNLNTVILYGVEVGGRLQMLDNLEAYGTLNYTRAEEKFRDGRTLPADRIPPLNGQLGLFYRPMPRLWVEPFVRFAATQDRLSDRDLIDPRINPRGTPGSVTANVRLGWEISERFRARLAVENVFDQPYREHGSGIDAPGINAMVSLEARF
ncbi:MAG: TonB-dependent receptor [Candidatus Methylomirabilis oxyfera]|nr:TonB-dependent receptor [Candidatus Methylomirabilis oxyfera]